MILNVLPVLILILFTGCGRLELPEGVISDIGEIIICDFGRFDFYYHNNYYGYIEFYKYSSDVRIKAPYGIYVSAVDLDEAPEDSGNNYIKNEITFDFGKYYFFKPDSDVYGKMIKMEESGGDTINLKFEFYIQTNRGNRDL